MTAKIVVEIICYNEEKYLPYSIGALYEYVDQIIITDSFSTDSTISVIKSLDVDHKISILQRKWTNDYAAQRNAGLDFIKKNIYPKHKDLYLLRVDGDEIWYSSKLANLKNIIAENPNINAFRTNFYTFEGTHKTLSKNNPIENRACIFKYNPDMFYVSALHEMPVISLPNNQYQLMYTHNLADDAKLGIKHLEGYYYCHFSWCDPSKNFHKAQNYEQQYFKEGKQTKDKLDQMQPNKDSWWWQGHLSNNNFTGEYPEIISKLGGIDTLEGTQLVDKLEEGKFSVVGGELKFDKTAPIFTNGTFSVVNGELKFDESQTVAKNETVQNQSIVIKEPKISAFTIIKSCNKFDYPIIESINSVLPFVDEYIVNVGMPDEDGTKELLIKNFGNNPKVKMFDSEWEGKDQGIKFLTSQTNLAKDKCENEWALYVQADELYIEEDFDKIKTLIKYYDDKKHIIGFAFDFLHFDGDYTTINPNSYKKEIRLVRKNYVNSIHDAVTFGVKAFSNTPLIQFDKMFVNSDVRVFHVGWVREKHKMLNKLQDFDAYYHNEKEWQEMHGKDEEKYPDGRYDYGKRENHLKYNGPYPKALLQKITDYDLVGMKIIDINTGIALKNNKGEVFTIKKDDLEAILKEQNKIDMPSSKKYIVEREVDGQKLVWENDLIFDDYVLVGDHIDVPGIGDGILHTAVIREVNKKFPGKKIIFRTMRDELAAFENNPRIFRIEKGLLPHSIDIPTGHYIEQKCRYFGIDNPEIKGEIFITDKEKAVAEETLKLLSGNKPTIMFCFNSTNPQKNWIKESWTKIVDVLNEKYDVFQIDQSIHYSRAADRPEEFGRPIIYPTIPNARQELRNAAGGIRKMMALMSVCKKYLGVNTAWMNIAAALENDSIVFQHDVDEDGNKLRNLISHTGMQNGFMNMSEYDGFNKYKDLRPEWLYPDTKYFDVRWGVEEVIREIKKLWM